MTKDEILTTVKTDLHISSNAYDVMLSHFIDLAENSLTRKGITLEDTTSDGMLVSQYAAYMYRARKQEQTEGVPRWLQIIINERLFSEKVGDV